MSTSVGTKAHKKQSSISAPVHENHADSSYDRHLEHSLLSLENACLRILEYEFADNRDTERRYWQHKFKNIVTPVSLALVECKGPRRFHYHYRHRVDDESILHPVLEPSPVATLSQVCQDALSHSRSELVGMQDGALVKTRDMLESALQTFLIRYKKYAKRLNK